MTDQLQAAVAWLGATRKESMARTVTYVRGDDTVAVAATVGKTEFPVVGPDGVQSAVESRDYIINSVDLVLDGAVVIPQRGDQVRDTVNGVDRTYEVLSPGGTQHYRFTGPDNGLCRIHTKLAVRG